MRRHSCSLVVLAVCLAWSNRVFAGAEAVEINLDYVAKRAEERARKPFHSPRADLPRNLRADRLDYDKYREIRFRRDKALWAADRLPFIVEFFHPGYLYEEPVRINEFSGNFVQSVSFVSDFFDYGKDTAGIKNQVPANTGYAGFRLLYPLNRADKMDELGAFLGASYFRLLGAGQRYGASARGLALDSGETDRPEEFPLFTDWWLGKPKAGDREVHLYALLDSVSCTGAYEFHIRPGDTTASDIEAIIYVREPDKIHAVDAQRKPLLTLGMAPLTSMFWFGKGSERRFDDYRPEVHDSDGLLLRLENNELLWRPLNNPLAMRHQRFAARNIRGFGLLQRDRDFATYQDSFNFYHQVPSLWVEPRGNWGEGDLHLLELATSYEGLDNIAAFWSPRDLPQPLQPYRFAYSLQWTTEAKSQNRVLGTRIGLDPRDGRRREIVVDFGGPRLAALPEGVAPEAVTSCTANGTIVETQVVELPVSGTWRVILKLEPKPDSKEPVDIRCVLKRGDESLSETWTYHWSPS
jgi:glucans biosynthesis protein